MTELGLSFVYMVWLAFLAVLSFVAYEFGLFIKPEYRVTTMNGAWPTAEKEAERQASRPVSFAA